jgi:hypothetical protein
MSHCTPSKAIIKKIQRKKVKGKMPKRKREKETLNSAYELHPNL